MRTIFVISLLLLCGCGRLKTMSRTEVIAAIKQCEQANLHANIMRDGWDFAIYEVECLPRDSK